MSSHLFLAVIMDRDKRWDREQKAYNAIRNFEGPAYASAKEGVEANYANDLTDEFVDHLLLKVKIMASMMEMQLSSSISALIEQLSCQKYLLIKHLMV